MVQDEKAGQPCLPWREVKSEFLTLYIIGDSFFEHNKFKVEFSDFVHQSMIPAMIASGETMLERLKNHQGREIEVYDEFRFFTSEVISRTAFGSSYLEGENIFEMLMKLAFLTFKNTHKIRFPGIRYVTQPCYA